ncbi:hypothetical protein [Polyangium sp. 15x6]|uniref:hypothetical protein n=1 Tax=Polyangium sp. 15x6 TaxID=3042687 RepID=UPI002499ECA9|nr:hypothetical protein [Polyangium sp. 15x6]MDI3286852.1 hypothetical protein [Polyangium sp. 15x6]
MTRLRFAQIASALLGFFALLPAASARDKGHRFVATVHGGAGTEAGVGGTLELRLLDAICLGGTFDYGVNYAGTYGTYRYLGPAVHGSWSIKFADIFELRPFFGARFPLDLQTVNVPDYKIVDNHDVAFTTGLRTAFILDFFVIGLQFDFTPHGVTWEQTSTGKRLEEDEYFFRGSFVLGVAFGPDKKEGQDARGSAQTKRSRFWTAF